MRANVFAKIVSVVMLFSCIIPVLVPPAAGDGISIPTREIDILFETRQLAYIKLNPDRTETLDMFVTMVSLDPGTEIKYFVPLKAMPTVNEVKIVSDEEFESQGIAEAKATVEKYSEGKQEFEQNAMNSMAGCTLSQMFTPFAASIFLISATSYGGGLGLPTVSYAAYGDGYSVSVLNFTTKDSLKEFISSLNLTVSQKLWRVIDNYADYHFVYITLKTMPPVPEEDFNEFAARCPNTLAVLRDFVKAKPSMYFYGYSQEMRDFINHPLLVNVKNVFYSEARNSTRLYETLNEILAVLYGYGKEYSGLKVSMRMPLADGKIYYPLGTSSSWEGKQHIQVLITMPPSFLLKDNPRGGSFLSLRGENCYYLEFADAAPDFDLEAEITEGIYLQGTAYQISFFFYRNPISAVYLVLLLFVLPWYIPFLWVARASGISTKPRWLFYTVPLAIGLLSLIHFLVGVVLTIKFLRKFKYSALELKKMKGETGWVRSAMLSKGIRASLPPFILASVPSILGLASFFPKFILWWNPCVLAILTGGIILYFLIFMVSLRMFGEHTKIWEGNVEIIWLTPTTFCVHTEMDIGGVKDLTNLKTKLAEKLVATGYSVSSTYSKYGALESLHFTGRDLEFAVLFRRPGINFAAEIYALKTTRNIYATWTLDMAQIDFLTQTIREVAGENKKEGKKNVEG
ncbi:MAG: hypothetical protein N3F63_02750 [Thermoplasmata archaeon]|nr:hypothetical protein [Thermoplasmata archaeon]